MCTAILGREQRPADRCMHLLHFLLLPCPLLKSMSFIVCDIPSFNSNFKIMASGCRENKLLAFLLAQFQRGCFILKIITIKLLLKLINNSSSQNKGITMKEAWILGLN